MLSILLPSWIHLAPFEDVEPDNLVCRDDPVFPRHWSRIGTDGKVLYFFFASLNALYKYIFCSSFKFRTVCYVPRLGNRSECF